MTITAAEGRQQILDALARAGDRLAHSLACLGEAYEMIDEDTADRLEADLFGPVQAAYGRAQKAHAAFAGRYGLPTRTFPPGSAGTATHSAGDLIERAASSAAGANGDIADLQDSLVPVEFGDQEIRAELAGVRELVDRVPSAARELLRTLGR